MTNTGKFYQLSKEETGIFLTVKNEAESTFSVKLEQLYQELKKRRISYETALVKKCFEEASAEKEKIASLEKTQIYVPILDTQISPNKMEAILKVYPALDETALEAEKLEQFLAEKKLVFGLKEEIFPEILKEQVAYGEWLIAEGKPSENGKDAFLEFHFKKERPDLRPKQLANGSVDFYDLDLIQVVEEGSTIVEKIPPTEGTNGMNVLGAEIKAKPGRDIRLPLGSNTEIDEAGLNLITKITGHVSMVGHKVNVYPIYEVKGNVDFSTGNIKFPGNVIVRGSVQNTFTVEAEGDVEIFGNLSGTVIAEGNLQIKKGIIQGIAQASGNVYVRYIENAKVFSQESVFVGEAILHSQVRAEKQIEVSGKRGLIAGGHLIAGKEVVAKNVGAPMGTKTILEVGYVPQLIDEYKVVCTKLKYDQDNLKKNDQIIKNFVQLEKKGKLSPDKKQLYFRVLKTQNKIEEQMLELQKRKNELELEFTELKDTFIKIRENVYCGLILKMGKQVLHIHEEDYQVVFRLEDYEIKGGNL